MKGNSIRKLYSSNELEELVKYKTEVIKHIIPLVFMKVEVLIVTTDINEHNAALSYLKPQENTANFIQYEHYIIGRYGLFNVALQTITNFRQTNKEFVSDTKKVFKNLSAIVALGVIRGVEKKEVKRLNVLVSKILSVYNPPNIEQWKNIMYLPPPLDDDFKNLLLKWSADDSIAHRLSEKPHCSFGNFLCGTKLSEDIIDAYPNADGIQIDNQGLFYKDVINYNCQLMIIKAVCGFKKMTKEERSYHASAALLAADCLNYILEHRKIKEIFENWLFNDYVIKRSLYQAKICGHKTTLRHLTILVAGSENVGKTCLLEILQGNNPPSFHDPTPARKSKKVEIATSKVEITSKNAWKPMNRSDQIAEISKHLRYLRMHPSKHNTAGGMNSKKNIQARNEDTTTNSKIFSVFDNYSVPRNLEENFSVNITEPDHQTYGDSLESKVLVDDTRSSDLNVQVVDKDFGTSIDDKFLNCSPSDSFLASCFLSIIDTAGQPELIQLLPAINKLSKITFIVFNMESKLEDPVIKENHKSKDHITLHYSNANVIECLMSMVSCSAQCVGLNSSRKSNDKFQVCLVGTHYDKVYSNKFLLKEISEKIDDLISNTGIGEVCSLWNLKDSCIHKIDTSNNYSNLNNTENEVSAASTDVVNKIRQKVEEVLKEGTENIDIDISLNWFLLELLIEEECSKNNKFYMKRKMVNELIQKQNITMSNPEINLALKYLHRTGILLYFLPSENDKLSKYVFSDPNWLFQQLTALVNVIHSENTTDDNLMKKLKYDGELHMSLVEETFKKTDLEIDLLLTLLEHMKIVAEMCQQHSGAEKIYFMPCVLSPKNLNEDLCIPKKYEVSPLHMKSKFGTIPRGVFCCLVVTLLEGKYIFKEIVGTPYNNWIEFQTTTKGITVKLIDRIFSFEIIVESKKDEPFIYHQVQHQLTCALTDIWKKFEYSKSQTTNSEAESSSFIEYGFICSHGKNHVTTVCKSDLICHQSEYRCDRRGESHSLEDKHVVWFAYKPSLKIIDASSNTLTLQWNSPILTKELHFTLRYSKIGQDTEIMEKELSTEELTSANGLVTYKVMKLISNTRYKFELAVVNEKLEIKGEYVELMDYTGPGKPTELTVSQNKHYKSEATVEWKPPDGSADRYIVKYSKEGEQSDISVETKNLTLKVDNLTAKVKYQFKIAAINKAGHQGDFTNGVFCHIKCLISENDLKEMVPNQDETFMKNNDTLAKKIAEETNILIITANDIEYRAVLYFLKPRNQEPGSKIYWYCHEFNIGFIRQDLQCVFGKFGVFNAAVHKMANQGPAAAQSTVIAASKCFEHLEAIFAIGVACGVEGKSDILDVIVAKEVTFYTDARLSSKDEELEVEPRSPARLKKSSKFIQYFLQEPKWTPKTNKIKDCLLMQPSMHIKEILSGNYLIDNLKIKNKLIEKFAPKAYGLEMECAGLFYDYDKHNVELMLVKAVCDLGNGKKTKDYQPTAALLAADCVNHYLSKGEIKPEMFTYNTEDLKCNVLDITKKFNNDKYSIGKNEAQQYYKKVELLLITTNDNEFNAVLYYMAKKHIKDRKLEDSDIPKKSLIFFNEKKDFAYFYIGEFADIPAALVKQESLEAYKISITAIEKFVNLRAIIPVGVCGTFERIGDVIISSKIVVYQDNKVNKSVSTSLPLIKHLKTPGDWNFNCFTSDSLIKQLSQVYVKPFLSPDISEAGQMLEDKIRDLCEDAIAFDMEGSGIAKAIEEHKNINFVIVKASGYTSTSEKKVESASVKEYKSAWEPVAAMAAVNFLHSKLDQKNCRDWFKGSKL